MILETSEESKTPFFIMRIKSLKFLIVSLSSPKEEIQAIKESCKWF